MNKFMRILVFFDLPVKTKAQRREATRFRNFLLTDGYHMLQYSVYARVCNGMDAVEKHRQRVKQNLPDNGAIRLNIPPQGCGETAPCGAQPPLKWCIHSA